MKRNCEKRETLFNRFLTESEQAKYAHMRQRREENNQTLRKNLKTHISTLNDGIVAIIITVMLLEIPFPTAPENYGAFLWAILIFFVSFFVVADFWYENKRVFETVKEVDHPIMIVNFLFLAALSLIPVMTKWIMRETIGFSVLNFGVVYMVTMLLQQILYITVVRGRFKGQEGLLFKIILSRIGLVLIPNIVLILLGWFFPKPIMVLYVVLPIVSFLQPGY